MDLYIISFSGFVRPPPSNILILQVKYDGKVTTPPQSHPGTRVRVGRSQQNGDAQWQEAGPLLLPQLTRLHETYHSRGEDDSNVVTIPVQHRVT